MGDVNSRGLLITGTDTGVGKTVFTSALARGLRSRGVRVAPYKPVCSGAKRRADGTLSWSDVDLLAAAADHAWPVERICPQFFQADLSPPAAAHLEGRHVDEELLRGGYEWLQERADLVLVEGAGGFYSPISSNWLNADLAVEWGLPIIVVAANRLGTINQTLLTIEAIRNKKLNLVGVVLNQLTPVPDASAASNAAEIAGRGGVRILTEIHFQPGAELQTWRLPETMFDEIERLITSRKPSLSTDSSARVAHEP